MRRRLPLPASALVAGALFLGNPGTALAQAAGPADADPAARTLVDARAIRTGAPPEIDGVLDEAAWRDAPALDGFTQREPADGRAATEPTEIRVLFDDRAIYIGVWAWDGDPAGIIPGERIRDYELAESDAVVVIFDTYNDDQNGFVFGTTPSGIEYDGQVANEGRGGGNFLGAGGGANRNRFQTGAGGGFNKNWDGSWTVATSRDGEGWYAEFRIPFNTLRYGTGGIPWGFNVSRRIRRKNEESFWAPVPREFSLYRLNYAGDLSGLELPFRRFGSVTPYALTSTSRDYDAGETEFDEQFEWGGEAKLQLTQGLTLDATYNTDFAQVEVDDQQLNLTRFSLLFPEKRPFFLENAGFFTVGGGGADLFFSRRIGIADGAPVGIKGGGRMSGRALGLNVGLLHIATDGLGDIQPENRYSVARIAKELPNRSRVGGIFVNRDSDLDGDFNRTYAADAQFGITEAFTVAAWGGRTETPGLDGEDEAFAASANLDSREWRGGVQFQQFGEQFNPEVGFLPRTGHRYYQGNMMRIFRPRSGPREIRPHFSYFTYRSRKAGVEEGFEESGRFHIDSHFEWGDGTFFSPAFNWVREGLYEPFTIPGTDVTVPAGTYDGWEAAWRFNTNRSASFVFDGGIDWGDFLSGTRRGGFGTLTVRSGASFSTSLRLTYNDVNLPEGDFETTLAGLALGYFLTPRIYVQSLVQYSSQVDSWSANVRFGWLSTAGTGLFIVYNDVQGVDDRSGTLGRSLIVKFSRQFNVLGG